MATFDVLGSCICRDGFGFREDNEHDVKMFLQSTSPITWFELNEKPDIELNMDSFSDMPAMKNFRKKCIINDYNKTVLDYFQDNADFFIIDFQAFGGTNLAKLVQDGKEHFFTYSKWFKEAYEGGLHKHINGKIEKVSCQELLTDELIEKILSLFVQWLRDKGYSDNQIILVEDKRVFSYSDGKAIYYFENPEAKKKTNALYDKMNACFKRLMPKCYFIKMPYNVYSNVHHPWGLTDLHYCKEFYDYLYECYDMISTTEDCQHQIDELRDRYSALLEAKRDELTNYTLSCMHGEQLLKGCIDLSIDAEHIAKISESRYKIAKFHNRELSIVEHDGKKIFVNNDDCVRGFSGNNKIIDTYWKTVNSCTLVTLKDNSFVIGHNGSDVDAQMQVIQTLDDIEALRGKVVTLSVWARVIETGDSNAGGTIAIINANDYNKGSFFAKKNFKNKEWKRITLTAKLPNEGRLKGVTICLRAVAGKGDNPKHARVEFSEPILYLLNKEN